ncbi:hypothetical protein [Robertkochia solimangrovi]|uniref:hypothetical protein n=1 Tax=Robertkochia solimangrovi TaxID=2213046 RepID=UPI00117C3852|nr:hypothetical protein [Robertkochia solimangrovi]TRZ41797.1 hypothetical protein DMZ48_15745 [Robertkochia solimangrovi]
MIKIFKYPLMIFAMILWSCTDKDDNIDDNLASLWELNEVLSDPGDGSGTFHEVDSDKYLKFFEDGTLQSNYSLCELYEMEAGIFTTTYDADASVINLPGDECGNFLQYEIKEGELYLYYPCFEACAEKYERVR